MSLAIMGNADSCLFIDLDAITSNWRFMDGLSSTSTKTAAVVKANGYGLGANEVVAALASAGCNEFFVANLEEAIALRLHLNNSINLVQIMTLHGFHPGQLDEYVKYRITPVLNNLEQLSCWRVFNQQKPEVLPALVHVDTGMTRLGFDPDEIDWVNKNRSALDGLNCRYLMSHLVSAEIANDPANAAQLAAFNEFCNWFPRTPASLANSAGIMLSTDYHFQMTRPGIALYGVHSSDQARDKLTPTVKWQARILQVRHAKAGDRVGYGGTHLLCRDSTIATIAVGYADGYNRKLGGKATVLIGTQIAPVIGRVSMDSITVDVSDIDPVHLQGGTAELLHDGYDLSQMAFEAETISYEILTKLGARSSRHYQNTQKLYLQ